MMILQWGNISGGNFNPAVTLGVLITHPRQASKNSFLFFVSTLAQYTGAFLGMFLAYLCQWQWNEPVSERTIATLEPATSEIGAFLSEIVCTFIFISVILMVKDPITAPSQNGWLCCFTVGLALLSCITLSGGHTGAALNPAVGLV